MKKLFTTALILCHFAHEQQTAVEKDVSDYTLGWIPSPTIDKNLQPVAFHSQKFNTAVLNYEIYGKVLLGIVTAFKNWRHYLERSRLLEIVYTDHKNL